MSAVSPRLLPALYVAWALPLILAVCWLLPPWQSPDEVTHVLRIVQIADGGLVGVRIPASGSDGRIDAGGLSDPAVFQAAGPLWPIAGHPDRKVTLSALVAGDAAHFKAARSAAGFPNTAQYPPVLYLPGVVALAVGRLAHASVQHTLYLIRGANGLVAVLITALALALARRTRPLLALLAILPMTVSLDASASQDPQIIALALLATALLDRAISAKRAASTREFAAVVAALGLVATARPPYAPLALLVLLAAPRPGRREIAGVAGIIAAVGLWSALVGAVTIVRLVDADATAQLHFLLGHPWQIFTIAWLTLRDYGPMIADGAIGQLGWLDVSLPHGYVLAGLLIVVLCLAAALDGPARRPVWPALGVLAAAALVFGVQYLTWTRPGAPRVDGVQGRYFIPIVAALALAVPGLRRGGPAAIARPSRPDLPALALAVVGVFAVATPVVMLRAMVLRYYVGAG